MFAVHSVFFPEKPSTESKGEKPSCSQPQVRPNLDTLDRQINLLSLYATKAANSSRSRLVLANLRLVRFRCDTFENMGKHFSDLAANLIGPFQAAGVHDRIIGHLGLL